MFKCKKKTTNKCKKKTTNKCEKKATNKIEKKTANKVENIETCMMSNLVDSDHEERRELKILLSQPRK